jgi:hypothetical protein
MSAIVEEESLNISLVILISFKNFYLYKWNNGRALCGKHTWRFDYMHFQHGMVVISSEGFLLPASSIPSVNCISLLSCQYYSVSALSFRFHLSEHYIHSLIHYRRHFLSAINRALRKTHQNFNAEF